METEEEQHASTSVMSPFVILWLQEGIVTQLSFPSIPAPPHPQRGLEGVRRREDCMDGARCLYV